MMRRKGLNRSAKPMRATGFKSAAFKKIATKEAGAVAKVKRAMKQGRPKMTKIRKAARGQECTLRLPGCNWNPETTVLCHDNRLSSGKGMGLKAPDSAAVFGCSSCHDMLDGRAPRPAGMTLAEMYMGFDQARERTHEVLRRMGLMPEGAEAIAGQQAGATAADPEQ